jgi:hypothetical protein
MQHTRNTLGFSFKEFASRRSKADQPQMIQVLGEISVRNIAFKVDGNLEQNGQEFIKNLALPAD